MKIRSLKIIILAAVIFSSFIVVSSADQGTTSAVFLKLEQGVRPIAMGGAFTGASDDVNAVMWNPAGLSQLPAFQLTFSHSFWFASIFYDYIAAAYPAGNIGTFGLGIVYLNAGDIPSWDEAGNPQDSFSANDIGVNIAYGTTINSELSLGVTLKLFNEAISDAGAFGFAADLGCIYKLPVKDLQIGATLQNLGPKFGFGEAFMLPIQVKVGLSYKGVPNLMLNLDYIQPIETNGILAIGMEYWYRNLMVLRL
ncbi:MAG: PorV/PorQ family protein, partial [Spirochaetia bacterium]|nr:PorV/PorQ family protein [Spirochaetia bacterium]